ncbi:winged helix DNA-binding domain-containing protein [Phytoactinopolyspora limicola]|uniref:winged helix DNA-binding domain-containing protein n=1 Tax=Phytoactinopolyspora limicola TaxID=2715536 RepID=UPI00140CE0F0|nr:winged helix DNA-binding domain-containing protein [Phytoactinopolyspora limicola]
MSHVGAPGDVIDVASARMHATGLAGQPWSDVDDVVRRLGAVQAQDFGPAIWSLGQRLDAVTEGQVLAAVDAGVLIRTHVLRPTWHFVRPDDVRWMLELTAPRVHAFNAYYYRTHELDARTLEACTTLIVEALHGGAELTRGELATVLERGGVAANSLRLGLILMYAELEQAICSGVRRGKQQTYTLLDERVPTARRLSRDEQLAELTRRYFTSHGPATARDFHWWSSLTMAEIRSGLDLVADTLERAVVDDVTYYWSGGGAGAPADPPATVHLLQPYDEYVVAYTESRAVYDIAGLDAAKRPERGAYNGVVLLDTQVAGNWKRTIKSKDVVVDLQLYRPFDDGAHAALQAAADRHAAFLNRKAVVNSPDVL